MPNSSATDPTDCPSKTLFEETLSRNFFYYCCMKKGADYRLVIRLYRRLEPLEILMKICFGEEHWLDERDKNVRFLIKNPVSKPAADIVSGLAESPMTTFV